jgi:hypothetical protein
MVQIGLLGFQIALSVAQKSVALVFSWPLVLVLATNEANQDRKIHQP